jgi:ubiquitin-like protein Nedd8
MKAAFLRMSVVLLFASPTLAMKIFVKMTGGKTIFLEVEPADSIQKIKEKIQEETNIPADQQLLIGRGLKLEDERTLCEYSLFANATLNLIHNVRGD